LKTVSPDGAFLLDVPDDCLEDEDAARDVAVASYWRTEDPILLQVSSVPADDAAPAGALDLLKERLVREDPSVARVVPIGPAACPDWAAAGTGPDEEGLFWLYGCAVWPGRVVEYSATGLEEAIRADGGWVAAAIRSLRPAEE
jgi:hypothetical protein